MFGIECDKTGRSIDIVCACVRVWVSPYIRSNVSLFPSFPHLFGVCVLTVDLRRFHVIGATFLPLAVHCTKYEHTQDDRLSTCRRVYRNLSCCWYLFLFFLWSSLAVIIRFFFFVWFAWLLHLQRKDVCYKPRNAWILVDWDSVVCASVCDKNVTNIIVCVRQIGCMKKGKKNERAKCSTERSPLHVWAAIFA